MTKTKQRKDSEFFLARLLKLLILIVILVLLFFIGYLLYRHFWLKSKETELVNYNINIHNQLERKSSEILDRVNRNIKFTGQSSDEIRQDLKIARNENEKLSEIIQDYETRGNDLKDSKNQTSQNLKKEIENSFEVKKTAVRTFQEVNNYLICLGENTVDFVILQEKLTFYAENEGEISSEGAVDKANRELEGLNLKAINSIEKIPSCFKGPLVDYKDPEIDKIIQESSEFIDENSKIKQIEETGENKKSQTSENEIPIFKNQNRAYLEIPVSLISEAKENIKKANQKVEQASERVEL
jgi:ribosomal protein S18